MRFCALWPWASCPGGLAWFGHSPGRTANIVTENLPSITGLASCYDPIDDVFIEHQFCQGPKEQ